MSKMSNMGHVGSTSNRLAALIGDWHHADAPCRHEDLASVTRQIINGRSFTLDGRGCYKRDALLLSYEDPFFDVLLVRLQATETSGCQDLPLRGMQVLEIDRLYFLGKIVPTPPDAPSAAPWNCPGPLPQHPGLSACPSTATIH
ncbi:hypothetical protein C7W88_17865 (plasmid) [Novosphingobium sp. THN1]|uniref:hypothetical protein n=1 Tax=Novosphingobium sp. THN1 TaxID=1016987 RepID=UPI000E4BDFEF|nr:hypothetical protein [Novosphingobium sp. THN1]AXU20881.1 hypothetical protein C7W88_17865 [Novosphingobium sp. THN1]